MRPRFYVLSAGTDQDIDTIFAGLIQQRIGVLLVSADPFFLQLTPEQQSFRRHLVGENLKRIATVRPPTHEPSKEEMAEIRAAVEAAGLTPRAAA